MSDANNPILSGAVVPTFFYYAVSAMVGLVAITTSNLVDGVFVGNYVGSDALAAITLLVPCFTVLFATGLMFAIGGSVAAGKHMGADDEASASEVFSQTLIAASVVALVFAVVSRVFEAQLYRMLSVPAELEPLVNEYFDIIRWVLVLQLTTMVLYYFVRADGHPALATAALLVGALGNLGLDALFIIRFEMGLAGAAYAVAISQILQAIVLCSYFRSRSRSLKFRPIQARWGRLLQATYNGASEFVNEISAGAILWLLNHLLIARVGVAGVAAFSVVNYYIFLSLMLSYGIADALHLLASQNYGAQDRRRIQEILLTALGCSLALGGLLTGSILVWRTSITSWFLTAEEAAIADAAMQLLLVIWPLFVVNGTNIVFSCYLTAIQRPRPSALIASLRGLVLPAGLLVALYLLFDRGTAGARSPNWTFLAALPLAEWTTFIFAFWLCYRHRPTALNFGVADGV